MSLRTAAQWPEPVVVLVSMAVAFGGAVALLEVGRSVLGWPQWAPLAVLPALAVAAWLLRGLTSSDLWATVWECAWLIWVMGAVTFAGNRLDIWNGFVIGGTLAVIVGWRRLQVRRGRRETTFGPRVRESVEPQ